MTQNNRKRLLNDPSAVRPMKRHKPNTHEINKQIDIQTWLRRNNLIAFKDLFEKTNVNPYNLTTFTKHQLREYAMEIFRQDEISVNKFCIGVANLAKVHQHNYKNNNFNNKMEQKKVEFEKDLHKIAQRMRQLDLGKETTEYNNYVQIWSKQHRSGDWNKCPKTPNPKEKMPNKVWKKKVQLWRIALHRFKLSNWNNLSNELDDNVVCEFHAKKKLMKLIGQSENIPQTTVKQETPNKKLKHELVCSKCDQTFTDAKNWQLHRQNCTGDKVDVEEKEQEQLWTDFPMTDDDLEDSDLDQGDEKNSLISSLKDIVNE